jgi:hypothetical protein
LAEGIEMTGHYETATSINEVASRMTWSRIIGALFFAGFLVYGVGAALVSSIVDDSDFIATISEHETLLVTGVLLMFLNVGVDIGKGVLFFPILENYSKRTALVYFGAITAQAVLLAIGGLFILMLVPLGDAAEQGPASWAQNAGDALVHGNTMAYHMGQAVLSFGGVFMTWILFRVRLIPRLLAGLGVLGYILHGTGSLVDLFGLNISIVLLIPGAIFELGLGFWLIFRGFSPEVYAQAFRSSLNPTA